jgi:thiol:disulfide interchange protein
MRKIIFLNIFIIYIILFSLLLVEKYHTYNSEITKSVQAEEKLQTKKEPEQKKEPETIKTTAESFKEALELSKKHDKPIFVYFGANWCYWCKKMKTDTLNEKDVKNKLDKEYITVFIDTDKDKETTQKFKVSAIPDYMILSSDEIVLKRATASKSKKDFLDWLKSEKTSRIK